MPTSRSRLRVVVRVVAVIIFLVLADMLVTFVRVPYGAKSEVSWTEYAAVPDGELDTIIIGTSTVMAGLDPRIIDEHFGTRSQCLASPDQWIEESYLALKTAWEDHHVTRAILGIAHGSVTREGIPNTGSTFMFMRSQQVSLRQNLEGYLYLLGQGGALGQTESLGFLAPWAFGGVENDASALADNVRMKLDGTPLREAAAIADRHWDYQDRGFGPYIAKINYDKVATYFRVEGLSDPNESKAGADELDPDRVDALVDICDFCEEHGIELIAVAAPIPAYRIIEYGEGYFAVDEALQNLLQEHGVSFYDFSLATPEILSLSLTQFSDAEHVNPEGAQAFTEAFCEVLSRAEAGEDIGTLFRSGEEYLHDIDYVATVFLDGETFADGIHLRARAMAGPDVDVEYQFAMQDGQDWPVIRDWSSDPEFTFLPEGGRRGAYTFCVYARKVGSEAEYDRYRVRVDTY